MRTTAVVLAIAVLAVAVIAQVLTPQRSTVFAAQDSPAMTVIDERKAGAKDPEMSIYIFWPSQRRVEAYNSSTFSFTVYDFASRKVTTRSADLVVEE